MEYQCTRGGAYRERGRVSVAVLVHCVTPCVCVCFARSEHTLAELRKILEGLSKRGIRVLTLTEMATLAETQAAPAMLI